MQRALEALPAVAAADVHVALPDSLIVDVTERTPTFVVIEGDSAFVLDRDGHVLDAVERGSATELGLPIVIDNRSEFAPNLEVGGVLDEVSLQADLRLAALTPAMHRHRIREPDDLPSRTQMATCSRPSPNGWRAIFGHYTPNLRPVDVIDRQVQCLTARVGAGEEDIALIFLAPLDEGCGTYLPRGTPAPVDVGVTGTALRRREWP